MRDGRTTRMNATHDNTQGYGQPYGNDAQPTGFNRHTVSNARKVADQNPIASGARKLGGAVASLGRSAAAKISRPEPRAPRTSSVPRDEGDFLGAGAPCRACGNPVESDQPRCPHCGAYVTPPYRSVAFWVVIAVAVALVVLLTLAINSCRSTQDATVVPTPGQDQQVDPNGATGDAPSALADKSALMAAVASAQSVLDAQAVAPVYTAYAISVLQTAVNTANQVLLNEAASAEEVSAAATAVSAAMDALATPLADVDYPWYDYADLVANLGAYVGQQVAVNGTTQSVVVDDATGMVTAVLAVAGNADNLVFVQYNPAVADGAVDVAVDFTAMGTVSGSQDSYPVVLADRIEVM